jgi:hypothetical protein
MSSQDSFDALTEFLYNENCENKHPDEISNNAQQTDYDIKIDGAKSVKEFPL